MAKKKTTKSKPKKAMKKAPAKKAMKKKAAKKAAPRRAAKKPAKKATARRAPAKRTTSTTKRMKPDLKAVGSGLVGATVGGIAGAALSDRMNHHNNNAEGNASTEE